MKSIYGLLTASVILLAGCSTSEEDTYDLSERFEVGDQWTLTMNMDEAITGMNMSGVEGEEKNSTTFWWDMAVTDVADGITTMASTYSRVVMNGWDSADTAAVDSMGYSAMMGHLVGMELTSKSDSRGNLVDLSGADGMFSMGNPAVDDNKIQKEFIEISTKWRPEGDVAVGDSWEIHHAVSFGYPMKYHNVYTLREVADGIAYIDLSSKMEPYEEAGPTWFGPMKLTQWLSGTMTGTIEVDVESGWAMKSVYKESFSGTYDMEMDTMAMQMMASSMPPDMESMGGMDEMPPSDPIVGAEMSAEVTFTYEAIRQ